MFFHQKTLINTKYKCQKKEKIEHENSVKIQWKICGETKCFQQKSDHVTPGNLWAWFLVRLCLDSKR